MRSRPDTPGARLAHAESYAYDALYRLTGAERTGVPNRWFYDYDAVGNRLSAQSGNSVTEADYDDGNRLLSLAGEGPLRWRGTLDEAGAVAFTSATVNGQPARMLPGNTFETTLDLPAGPNTVTIEATDASSNTRTVTYQVNVSGASAVYDYDASGNLVQKLEGGTTWTYVWDAENQLRWVCNTTPCTENGAVVSFKYDALGRRVEKKIGAVVQTFVYDGVDILRDDRGGSVWIYTHGPGIDEPLARTNEAGAWRYFHADGLGSIVKVTNASGAVTDTMDYDPFGQLLAGTPARHAFTGREWDGEVGLYYYRARYYDPKTGRFISEDPIQLAGGINYYAYVRGRPTSRIDPYKLYDCMNILGVVVCTGQPSAFPALDQATFAHEDAHDPWGVLAGTRAGWQDEQIGFAAEVPVLQNRIDEINQFTAACGTNPDHQSELNALNDRLGLARQMSDPNDTWPVKDDWNQNQPWWKFGLTQVPNPIKP